LLDAHKSLDDLIERAYVKNGFKSDEDRLKHLFKMYEQKLDKEDK